MDDEEFRFCKCLNWFVFFLKVECHFIVNFMCVLWRPAIRRLGRPLGRLLGGLLGGIEAAFWLPVTLLGSPGAALGGLLAACWPQVAPRGRWPQEAGKWAQEAPTGRHKAAKSWVLES